MLQTATSSAQRRCVDTFKLTIATLIQEVEDRDCGRIRDIESYLNIRREVGAVKPSFAMIEIHLNLPDRVHNNPIIKRLYQTSNDLVTMTNDLCSYNVE
jgi:hypothetical protein